MHPVLFHVPGLGFPIRTFGALVACGILLAIWIWGRLLARHGADPREDPQRSSQIAIWVVIGVIVGARLFYVGVESARYLSTDVTDGMRGYLSAEDRGLFGSLLEGEELETARRISVGHDFLHDPFKILLIWQGGLVMYGGLFGGILLGVLAARKHGLEPWRGLDTGLTAGFFGLLLGRWGCLFVGDDYGSLAAGHEEGWRPLRLDNGGEIGLVTLRVPRLDWLQQNPESLFDHELAGKVLWATQPWMSFNALVLGLVGLVWLRQRWPAGVTTALLLVQYALCRFAIEFYRGDEVRGVWFGGRISTSQLVSIVLLVTGLWLLVRRRAAASVMPAVTPRS